MQCLYKNSAANYSHAIKISSTDRSASKLRTPNAGKFIWGEEGFLTRHLHCLLPIRISNFSNNRRSVIISAHFKFRNKVTVCVLTQLLIIIGSYYQTNNSQASQVIKLIRGIVKKELLVDTDSITPFSMHSFGIP